ncbi:LPXTG cell wall anchor domain-containing protein, partial [Georgenia alba]
DPFVLSGDGYTPDSTIQGQTLAEDGTVLNEFTADADDNGAFSQDLEVPADLEPGTYGVRMTDTTGATAETTATVIDTTVDPTVTIEPNQLAPGDPFVLSGDGYTPDSTIQGQTLAEDGTVLNEFTADADQNGAFSQDLEVPADLEPGTYGVRMTDTTGATAETTATVIETGGDDGGQNPGEGNEGGSGDDGTGEDGTGESGSLPETGTETAVLGAVALALIVAGGLMVRAHRRSRIEQA